MTNSTETLQGALPRPGRIYVFLKNKLWRELETDGKGQLFEVDVAHWRKIAEKKGDADKREPVCVKQYLILVPMFLQGRFVGDNSAWPTAKLPGHGNTSSGWKRTRDGSRLAVKIWHLPGRRLRVKHRFGRLR